LAPPSLLGEGRALVALMLPRKNFILLTHKLKHGVPFSPMLFMFTLFSHQRRTSCFCDKPSPP
jgi:hypothetical protein